MKNLSSGSFLVPETKILYNSFIFEIYFISSQVQVVLK